MNHAVLNRTESLFRSYLEQEGVYWQYEPYDHADKKNPDFLFEKNGKKILVEVKEIEALPLDKIAPATSFSLDPKMGWDLIRDRIKGASRQLKPYKDDADYCVVMLGKKHGWSISLQELGCAVFGNPKIIVKVNPLTGKSSPPKFIVTESGAFTKRRARQSQEAHSPYIHSYISAVGLVSRFNGYDYYQGKFFEKFIEGYNKARKINRENRVKLLDDMQIAWEKHIPAIPHEYRDPQKIFYKVEMLTNPSSRKKLSADIFAGRWDQVIFPKIPRGRPARS